MCIRDRDVEVFAGTVADNVRLGRPGAGPAELAEAAELAGFDEVVAELPQGWDTVIGERGLGLSGGQRARLALARALLLQAPILILDEAVAHLDPALEARIVAALAVSYTHLDVYKRQTSPSPSAAWCWASSVRGRWGMR